MDSPIAAVLDSQELPGIDLQAGIPPQHSLELFRDDGSLKSLPELEAEIIAHAIKHLGSRMTEVARQLDIGRSTLYRKKDGPEMRCGERVHVG